MINVVMISILSLILVVVITTTYYVNKEGFDDVSNGYYSSLSNDLNAAVNTISSDISPIIKDVPSSTTGDIDALPSKLDKKESQLVTNVSSQSAAKQVSSNTASPMRTDIVPQVTISPDGHAAAILQQKSELLKDIQKVVRNEVLANRNTTPLLCGDECSNENSTVTDAAAQGQEYENSCYKDKEYRCPKNPDGSCPPVPDMTQYVKKDSIPCWGCSLDY